MSALTATFAGLFYFATLVLLTGLVYKISVYARTPAPLKITTTPAPITRKGVVWRLLKEVTIFESLFKSNKWIWAFGWMFHVALALVLFRHLRYFIDPVWTVVALVQPLGKYAAFAMLAGLLGLFARRIVVDRIRYISAPSDYLMLLLIIGIGVSGAAMKFADAFHTDIPALKAFFLGLLNGDFKELPADTMLLVHLSLVLLLMIIFPVSKLLHAPGVFFSPTRNQRDNPREQRHIQGWTADDSATSKPV
ncbi:MAG: respiratory nitrate reductase subunit gamma [Proteobacteria bacterium]|nr:respiratory nitrate reductase subunit gamma [Pseudomonadota bacterium]